MRNISLSLVAVILAGCGATSPTGSGGTGGTGGTAGADAGSGACGGACGTARTCCDRHCVNLDNDPQNCGRCGVKCAAGTYCTNGACVVPECQTSCSSAGTCCGAECCGPGQLCCDPQGPISRGPVCTTPNEFGTCPVGCAPLCVCASPDTPIATPAGNRAIASLKVGDLVYSVDHGRIVAVPVVRTNRSPVSNHRVVRVTLSTGAVLAISARHPTADGRMFGDLHVRDSLDGIEITDVRVVPYSHEATYDILPRSDSGAYFAGGALVGSTLARDAALVQTPTAPLSNMR